MHETTQDRMEKALREVQKICEGTGDCCGCPAYAMTADNEHCRFETEKANPTQWDWLWEA